MSSRDAFDRVIKSVKRVREQGEKPEEDLRSMDKYTCDLCHNVVEKKEIIQCGFCGRWVCKENCWDGELRACESCSGLILLAKEDKEERKDERNR